MEVQNTSTELVSSSVVTFNGTQEIGTSNFNQNVLEVDLPIFPNARNTLSSKQANNARGLSVSSAKHPYIARF